MEHKNNDKRDAKHKRILFMIYANKFETGEIIL